MLTMIGKGVILLALSTRLAKGEPGFSIDS